MVDLPVQRERHTQWPLIPASALKGVLRDRCRERVRGQYGGSRKKANEEDPDLVAVFGPGKIGGDDGSSHAGALAITDARILAFPVRSLKGVFAWVTCPALIGRLYRDLGLADRDAPPFALDEFGTGEALCSATSPLLVDKDWLVLEEFEFKWKGEAGALAEWIAGRAVDDEFTRARLKSHLAVLRDDDFSHFVRHATEVVVRIALDYERKTVKTGALFYQEFLPPETLFYSVLLASDGRSNAHAMPASAVLAWLNEHIPRMLQIGGDETTGKGLCAARLVSGKDGGQ
ncbi:MAG TPA: type III-B CRISPR module RAMP protein Cmr4 [Pirellulales bacterium]|nr:type III-B CRISPR module RAMP protein Cmr4 [Pirellulales bacterium]